MDGTTWIDPRYADLVERWSHMQQERVRRGPVHPCPACLHGLGTIMMVNPETKEPISIPCAQCNAS